LIPVMFILSAQFVNVGSHCAHCADECSRTGQFLRKIAICTHNPRIGRPVGESSATKKLRLWADSFRFAVTGNQFGKRRAAGTQRAFMLAIRRYLDVSFHRFDIEVAMRSLVDELRKVL
jgi:hypothetical protein